LSLSILAFASAANHDAFTNNTGAVATDFHFTVSGTFTEDPTLNMNQGNLSSGGKGQNVANFTGINVPDGGSVNLVYHSTGDNVNPRGFFTPNGSLTNLIHSIDPNGNVLASVEPGGGVNVVLSLSNDVGATLSGQLTVVVNNGLGTYFDLPNFDSLDDPTTITAFSFAWPDGFTAPPITAHLGSDQYLLVYGSADDGDGSGTHSFASAFSPDVPEPATIGYIGMGIGLIFYCWHKRPGSNL
jgi:hypothetical protein